MAKEIVTEREFLWAKKHRIRNACFISDQSEPILVSGDGSTITFTDLETGNASYYRVNGENAGDGVSDIAGHKTLPIFAFTELCYKPKIYVLTYPSYDIISICKHSDTKIYLAITFTETEHLIALTGMPDFQIQVWFWRTGTLQVQLNSNIQSDHQIIRCSRQLPITIAQLAMHTGAMNVYEVHGSMDLTRLIDRKIKLPFQEEDGPFFCVFGNDNMINLVIGNGNIYQISPVTCISKLIIEWCADHIVHIPIITLYKSGLLALGPDANLKYFKRQPGGWSEIFCIPQELKMEFMRTPFSKDIIIAVQENGGIMKITPDAPDEKITILKKWNLAVKDFTIINPGCEAICSVDVLNNLCLLKITDGEPMYCLEMNNITCMEEHPFYPYVAFGDDQGILTLISFHDVNKPIEIAKFYICNVPINLIKFSKAGNFILCLDSNSTSYLIDCRVTGNHMDILNSVKDDDSFIDVCIDDADSEDLKIVYLIGIPDGDKPVNSSIMVHYVRVNVNDMVVRMQDLGLPQKYYRIEVLGEDTYYAAQYTGYDIHVLKINEAKKHHYIVINHVIRTIHQLKHVNFAISQNRYLITWGFDGLIGIYDVETKKYVCVFPGNQRSSRGTRKARFDPYRGIVAFIGHSGNLHCIKLKNTTIENIFDIRSTLPSEYRDFLTSLKYVKLHGFVPHNTNHRWTDIQEATAKENEKELFKGKREAVIIKLNVLKEKLKVLLDNNEYAPENEKLQIQDFNLNTEASTALIETARKQREEECEQMRRFIMEQNRVSDWIRKNCWDTMSVQGTKVRAIFSNINVENYALLEDDPNMEKEIKKIRQFRTSEMLVSYNDVFEPWKPQTASRLEFTVLQRPQIYELEVNDEKSEKHDFRHSLNGTTTHLYIEPLDIRYHQLEIVAFHQMFTDRILALYDNLELRKFFNKKLMELQEVKKIEVNSIKQRNERKREIQKELNILLYLKGSSQRIRTAIIDPELKSDEVPETIVETLDSEVAIQPYISPSRQAILAEEAEEAERRRLALLADDFRERALQAMMNGVLEIKWEDEIKKNPPIPPVLTSGKDPKEYDEADLKTIQEYENIVEALKVERNRYEVMLDDEKVKLQQHLDSQILKFNFKVCQMHLLKMKIDAAIKQEEMKLLRNSWRNFERIRFHDRINFISEETVVLNHQITKLNTILRELEQKVVDLKHEYETLSTKDRQLEKQFKSNFVETAPRSIIDQVYKIFKRRPKWQLRAWATTPIVLDLAKRVITRNSAHSASPLPTECHEFLALLNHMDSSSVAPSAIDETLWQVICKMRRIKIESEFKLKACGLQLAEMENACNAFMKELTNRKNEMSALSAKLEEVNAQRLDATLNRTLQLVVKRGMVEIDLTGKLSDFDNSILLHYSDVNSINKVIKKVGAKKLRTMQNAAIFRRKIIFKEWEHRYLRNKVRDMQDFQKTIEKCKITKEIQRWLKFKEHKWTDDISQKALDREIESTMKSCQRALNEQRGFANEFEAKLTAKRKENKMLDNQIQQLNVVVTERQMGRDLILEEREETGRHRRMQKLVERARLVRLVQEQHAQILHLSTTLELQRLRTFPTLSVYNPEDCPPWVG